MHTIFVSNGLSNSHGGLLVRVLEHQNLGKLDSEPVTQLAMQLGHVLNTPRLCFCVGFRRKKKKASKKSRVTLRIVQYPLLLHDGGGKYVAVVGQLHAKSQLRKSVKREELERTGRQREQRVRDSCCRSIT